jgi:hypothetical protein
VLPGRRPPSGGSALPPLVGSVPPAPRPSVPRDAVCEGEGSGRWLPEPTLLSASTPSPIVGLGVDERVPDRERDTREADGVRVPVRLRLSAWLPDALPDADALPEALGVPEPELLREGVCVSERDCVLLRDGDADGHCDPELVADAVAACVAVSEAVRDGLAVPDWENDRDGDCVSDRDCRCDSVCDRVCRCDPDCVAVASADPETEGVCVGVGLRLADCVGDMDRVNVCDGVRVAVDDAVGVPLAVAAWLGDGEAVAVREGVRVPDLLMLPDSAWDLDCVPVTETVVLCVIVWLAVRVSDEDID